VAPGWLRLVSSPKRLHGCFGLGIGIESRTRCHFSGVSLLTKKSCSLLDHGQLLTVAGGILDFDPGQLARFQCVFLGVWQPAPGALCFCAFVPTPGLGEFGFCSTSQLHGLGFAESSDRSFGPSLCRVGCEFGNYLACFWSIFCVIVPRVRDA
jgi:hypothetical protein